MAESTNLKLYLTSVDDMNMLVADWIQKIAGNNTESNMVKLDSVISDLQDAIRNIILQKQDQLSGAEGLFVGFDENGKPAPRAVDAYELPIATSMTLGGVQPVAKTDDMTLLVGIDSTGRLWYAADENYIPSGGTTGQILSKKSETDYDLEWVDTYNLQVIDEVLQDIDRVELKADTNAQDIQTLADTLDTTSEEVRTLISDGDTETANTLRNEMKQLGDSVSMSVSQATGADGEVYATITLQVGDDMYTGQILMEGNLNVSGQLSADALYAAKGDIADLMVNRFSTSQRIKKYLAGDESDDNYIIAQGEALCFVSGTYGDDEKQLTGSYVNVDGEKIVTTGCTQVLTPEGVPLYWESYPYYNTEEGINEGVTKGTDGYPFKNAVRIFTTTARTPWPVMVYIYNELIKRSISFAKVGAHYVPVDFFGAGDADGNQQGRLVKDTEGLQLSYVTQADETGASKTLGIRMGDSGFTDIVGTRKTVAMNFANWDNGSFREQVQNGVGENEIKVEYHVEFYPDGRPSKITDGDDHEMAIYW